MKELSKDEFFDLLQEEVEKAGTQRQAAKQLGVTYAHLNDVLQGRKEPGPKVARALGYKAVINYSYQSDDEGEK